MKREFLKGLGLEKEQIDKIMQEYGNSVEKLKTTNEELITQQETTQEELKKFKDMDIDSIKKATQDLQTKYDNDTKELNLKLQRQEYNHNADKYFSNYEFSSEFARNGVRSEFDKKDFKFEDGKFLGADEWVNGLKESNPNAFMSNDNPERKNFGGEHKDDGESDTSDAQIRSIMGLPPKQ